MTAREAALRALLDVIKNSAYSGAAVQRVVQKGNLSAEDVGLCHQLVFGVLQQQLYLDFLIDQFSSVKSRRMEDKVLLILEIGIYQLLFLDRIPPHAAVDEAVQLTRKNARNPKASGLVNGVLRSIMRCETLPEPENLSVRYSHPQPLVDLWTTQYGMDKTEAIMASNNQVVPISCQVNSLNVDTAALIDSLQLAGVVVEESSEGLLLWRTGNIERLEAFQRGWFYVQDHAAHRAAQLAEVRPGMDVLDMCAAPGGKSFSMAIDMKNQGKMISCDIYPAKLEQIVQGAKRLGLTCIQPESWDATQLNSAWQEQFDVVFADVPCSGLGIIRKKPEIRYKSLDSFEELIEKQGKMLYNAFSYMRPGGTLIYATCTLHTRENEDIVNRFIAVEQRATLEHMETVLPCDGPHDGFFMAKLRKEF